MIEIEGIDINNIANNIEPFDPTHPGEVIKDEIEYRGISEEKLAAETGISLSALNDVLNGRQPVTIEYALLFEAALGVPAHTLIEMQADYNLIKIKRNPTFMERLKQVRKFAAAL